VGNEQEVSGSVAVIQEVGDTMGDPVVCSSPGYYELGLVANVREPLTRIFVGLLAQRDGRLDEAAFYIARYTVAGERGGSKGFSRARWRGAPPKMRH
jgi:hypothetical protein